MPRSGMEPPVGSVKTLAFLLLLAALGVQAQQNNNNNNNNNNDAAKSTAAAATSAVLTNLPNLSDAQSSTEASSTSAATSATSKASSKDAAPTVSVTNAPALSTTTTGANSVFHLTGLPTLAGAGIPSVGVPNTQSAPYMQKSTLPEGTVFIAVGAFLGFLGAAVLAWRGLVAWSLHRSVKRAALAQGHMDSKALLRGPTKSIYNPVGASSNVSLEQLNSPHSTNNRSSKYHGSIHTSTPKTTANLFFSPTAGAGMNSSGNRSSSYLPAGFYAPGSSAPAAGAPMAHIGGPPGPLSMGPTAAGYTRAHSLGPSPPGSPAMPPSSRGNDGSYGYSRSSVAGNVNNSPLYNQQQSVSSLNLSAPPQGRAPSAYLEDLFENHGNGPRERF